MSRNFNLRDKIRKMVQTIQGLGETLKEVFSDGIARRAFANNAFDGALTLLGILMGSIIAGEFHPAVVIKIGLGACLAMGMSGSFGRFLSERAERRRSLRQIESYMFTDLKGSDLEKQANEKIVLISLVDGLSPALAAIVPLIPFFFAQAGIITADVSAIASFTLDFMVLFALGAFLGRTSRENPILYGLLVVLVGVFTSLIIFLSHFWM